MKKPFNLIYIKKIINTSKVITFLTLTYLRFSILTFVCYFHIPITQDESYVLCPPII